MSETTGAEKDAPGNIGRAVSRGYCYACPTPIEVGEMWRRERVGSTVPHSFRLVHHPECPPMTAPVPLVERLAEAFREFWASDADDSDAEFIRAAPESVETSLEYARALLPVVEQAVTEARGEALMLAAKEAEERGDIGKDGGIEAWEWLRIRAGQVGGAE